jgi:acyl carrier protein
MQNSEIIKKINVLLIDIVEVEAEKICPSANLFKLGRDSLDYVYFLSEIERTFGFKISTEDIVRVKTVQDFYSLVIEKTNPN